MAQFLRQRCLVGSLPQAVSQPFQSTHFKCRNFSQHASKLAVPSLDALDASRGNRERVVILGSGWAGYTLAKQLSARYQTLVISPRSYFVFTPLLNSTSVGTLEFRTAVEPIRSRRTPNVEFMQGWADDVDFARQTVTIEEAIAHRTHFNIQSREQDHHDNHTGQMQLARESNQKAGQKFEIPYDKLVITVGCYSKTFNIPGVKEHAYFLKDISDARRIRRRILECFELASLPTTPEHIRDTLLRFAVVGGGPTGMEFAAELSDLVRYDLTKLYPKSLTDRVQIMVHDVAPKVLSMFGQELGKYAMGVYQRQGVQVKTEHHVLGLRQGLPKDAPCGGEDGADKKGCYTLTTQQDGEMGVGMCVWSTGLMLNPFMRKALDKTYTLPPSTIIPNDSTGNAITSSSSLHQAFSRGPSYQIEKSPKNHAILIDDNLRVQLRSTSSSPAESIPSSTSQNPQATSLSQTATLPNVYALGDTAQIRNNALPATAQTASQQALYLAKTLNKLPTPDHLPSTPSAPATSLSQPLLHLKPSTSIPGATATSTTSHLPPSPTPSTRAMSTATDPTLSSLPSRLHSIPTMPPFKFHNMGIMAYLGSARSIVQFGHKEKKPKKKSSSFFFFSSTTTSTATSTSSVSSTPSGAGRDLKGHTAWLFWRGAYLSMSLSWRNRVLMAVYWVVNWMGGRDVSRF